MPVVPLAVDDRLSKAFARYDAAWVKQDDELVAARLALCEMLVELGESLPPELHDQMAVDRAVLQPVAVSA